MPTDPDANRPSGARFRVYQRLKRYAGELHHPGQQKGYESQKRQQGRVSVSHGRLLLCSYRETRAWARRMGDWNWVVWLYCEIVTTIEAEPGEYTI